MTDTVLQVQGLNVEVAKKSGQVLLVKDVHFTLDKKMTLALVGESGSGKTTCAMSIACLLSKNMGYSVTGFVNFNGIDLLNQNYTSLGKIRGKEVSIIFQDPSQALNPVFTIGDQVQELFLYHEKITTQDAREKTYEILEKVGLPRVNECFDTYPHQISGGMKQRVVIAMASCLKPKLLIADEPTTALDASLQKEILHLLQALQAQTQMALLLITHDMGVVHYIADKVAVMYSGQIVELRSKKDIFYTPLHPYTKALLASRPKKGLHKEMLPVINGISPNPAKRPMGCPFHPRCPHAMPRCRSGEVVVTSDNAGGFVRCWLYENKTTHSNNLV